MAARIVLFGATGYTGRLVAEALVARGASPVLAGRNRESLAALAGELGGDGLETAVADVARPDSVRALVERGDVLVSTVGPFTRWGQPAVQAAVGAGAHYIDSTGEPGFIRQVFERFGAGAEAAGCGLVTACGYDWVPGNLAGALALAEAVDAAARVDIGYYMTGGGSVSGGTRASLVEAMTAPSFSWRNGRLVTERAGARMRSLPVRGRSRPGLSAGASEHFTLPGLHPGLREVNVYLGWFGPATRPVQIVSAASDLALRLPGARRLAGSLARRVPGSSGGPDAEERLRSGSHIVAIAYDAAGHELSEVHVSGVNGYTFTGAVLAWAAARAAEHGMAQTGALGPVQAFGLDALQSGCAEAGIKRE